MDIVPLLFDPVFKLNFSLWVHKIFLKISLNPHYAEIMKCFRCSWMTSYVNKVLFVLLLSAENNIMFLIAADCV